MKKALIIICVLVVMIIGVGVFSNTLGTKIFNKDEMSIQTINPPKNPTMCTQEAKLCSDGSYVGRTGPQCEFAECPKVQPPINTSTTTGINKKILNNSVYITPLKVIEDSRCPTDVNCIWAGTLKLLVKFEVGGKVSEQTITLGDSINLPSRRITFVSVSPTPNSKKPIAEGEYTFTFRVDKIAEIGEGTLKGHMTIGPICPVERIDNPCLPTAEMYASKKIYIYKADMVSKLRVATISPDAKGNFYISLAVGSYYVNMDEQAVGGITGIPTTIKIEDRGVITLNIDVDTGIR